MLEVTMKIKKFHSLCLQTIDQAIEIIKKKNIDPNLFNRLTPEKTIGSEEADASVCPQNRTYGSRIRLLMVILSTLRVQTSVLAFHSILS